MLLYEKKLIVKIYEGKDLIEAQKYFEIDRKNNRNWRLYDFKIDPKKNTIKVWFRVISTQEKKEQSNDQKFKW